MTAREYLLSFAGTIFNRLFDVPKDDYSQAMALLEHHVDRTVFIKHNGNKKLLFREAPEAKADSFIPDFAKRSQVAYYAAVAITMISVNMLIEEWKADLR